MVFKRAEISYKTSKGQNLARESWLNAKMFNPNWRNVVISISHNIGPLQHIFIWIPDE